MTLRRFAVGVDSIPTATSWYLADLGEARGKQELFTRQSPQKLKALREHAMIDSAVSSNRMEGVVVDQSRVAAIVLGRTALRDRNEEEVRGYRNALKLIHDQAVKLQVTEETIRRLHRLIRGDVWDAGNYKEKDSDIIETYPDGRSRVRFKTVPAAQTAAAMRELIELWDRVLLERSVHPIVALAAFNLDFLCIHPFRDGNGRTSRLLLLLQCYQIGFEVGRYISLERLIEQTKDRYYETLEQSSHGWHEGKHEPWSYVGYLLYTLKTAYREFEERVGQTAQPRGAKSELVLSAIQRATDPFRLADVRRECPGVSVDMIRHVLKDLRATGDVECLGRGQNAQWRKKKRRN